MTRPTKIDGLSGETFVNYYWLKEDLTAFCRENGLPTSGSKGDLTERIRHYLDTGKVLKSKNQPHSKSNSKMPSHFTPETIIGSNWRCTQDLRAFFEAEIGASFHFNQFMRDFIKRDGVRRPLQAAIDGWKASKQQPKGSQPIAPQFEYNQHMRDFFEQNQNATREEAIQAWNEKKNKGKQRDVF